MRPSPVIFWFRRDLRLGDHPGLMQALAMARAGGGAVLPVFILDAQTGALGAAALWRLGLGLEALAARLAALGAKLILRRGEALPVLQALVAETGARAVGWQRLYDPAAMARDAGVKAALRAAGVQADSHPGHLMFEPMDVATGQGGYYKVYTPFWNAVRLRPVAQALPAPEGWPAPEVWPASDALADWHLAAGMGRGAAVVRPYQRVGEVAALARLDQFIAGPVQHYREARDFPGVAQATSGLSENLAWGEIGPRRIWHAGYRAMQEGRLGAEHFLKELVWREFAYHLMYHAPHMLRESWREGWQNFPWRADNPDAERWRRGTTGEPFVDAAMREMYVTGRMHNRARMIVGSYLTKHLLTDWRVGRDWFAECLTDWDPAANAMGWQWVAGSGPDAAPYFRVFNPATQAEKFDADNAYRKRFIAGYLGARGPEALAYFAAVPRAWGMAAGDPYPRQPVVELAAGRARALAALSASKNQGATV